MYGAEFNVVEFVLGAVAGGLCVGLGMLVGQVVLYAWQDWWRG